ncbi:MAG: hypothetical protein AB8B70_09840, partial [Prochlorococcus sp.]
MTDSYSNQQQRGRRDEGSRDGGRGGFRGGRGQGNREQGGFRIRLSENEMRSARAIQEALNLRSTVAVLGFAVRTVGQMLEDGKLDELVAQHRAQAAQSGGGRRENEDGQGSRGHRSEGERRGGGGARPDPFARPAKPQPAAAESEPEQDTASEAGEEGQPAEAQPDELQAEQGLEHQDSAAASEAPASEAAGSEEAASEETAE